jgi:hypothetical protein
VTVAGVYRQLYRHCSEPLEHTAPVDRAARARETVDIHGGTRDGARTQAQVVWMNLNSCAQLVCTITSHLCYRTPVDCVILSNGAAGSSDCKASICDFPYLIDVDVQYYR